MKHTVDEVFRISNKQGLYDMSYLLAHNVPQESYYCAYSYIPEEGTLHTATGNITIYWFGEKTWFYTKEERDSYRKASHEERALKAYRKSLLDKMGQLTNAQLEAIIEVFEL